LPKLGEAAPPSEISVRRPGNPPLLIEDAQGAHKLLKWKPIRSALQTQIEDSWEWLKYHN
jgi:UDP-glucose 4-epimerase